jgi:Pyridoxamine 5'-phosphate oxidase
MNSKRKPLKVSARLFFLLLLTATWPHVTSGQEVVSRERELLAAAQEIITSVRYCALVTLTASREPQARTIDPFSPGADMVVWFATNPNSRKVKEIRHNPRVATYLKEYSGMSKPGTRPL